MILKSFKIFFCLLITILSFTTLKCEEKIDIWKNTTKDKNKNEISIKKENENKIDFEKILKSSDKKTIVENDIINEEQEIQIFGIYDPAEYNFSLNMWSSTRAEDVRASIKRIKKINLSKTSNEILENILLSFSYPPIGMQEKEFVKLKVDWLIENNRSDLIEMFLKQNKEFEGKKKAVQYLVDENIANADLKAGCDKIEFIDTTIKDSYLEKFKIYCLVFNKKKSQAQLLLDLLREQQQSDNFFDDKINFLLGISNKTTDKINEENLLNFYLSSITIKDFSYTPSKKTKKEIWKYLNAANLINLEDLSDKNKIKDLEQAANAGQVDEQLIFNIYKQIPFSLSNLINAKNLYQTYEGLEARSLIYQKYLLSEDASSKVEYLFILEDLFKKDNLSKVFKKKLSDNLKEVDLKKIPKKYLEEIDRRVLSD